MKSSVSWTPTMFIFEFVNGTAVNGLITPDVTVASNLVRRTAKSSSDDATVIWPEDPVVNSMFAPAIKYGLPSTIA